MRCDPDHLWLDRVWLCGSTSWAIVTPALTGRRSNAGYGRLRRSRTPRCRFATRRPRRISTVDPPSPNSSSASHWAAAAKMAAPRQLRTCNHYPKWVKTPRRSRVLNATWSVNGGADINSSACTSRVTSHCLLEGAGLSCAARRSSECTALQVLTQEVAGNVRGWRPGHSALRAGHLICRKRGDAHDGPSSRKLDDRRRHNLDRRHARPRQLLARARNDARGGARRHGLPPSPKRGGEFCSAGHCGCRNASRGAVTVGLVAGPIAAAIRRGEGIARRRRRRPGRRTPTRRTSRRGRSKIRPGVGTMASPPSFGFGAFGRCRIAAFRSGMDP